jgi:hypothetical protein
LVRWQGDRQWQHTLSLYLSTPPSLPLSPNFSRTILPSINIQGHFHSTVALKALCRHFDHGTFPFWSSSAEKHFIISQKKVYIDGDEIYNSFSQFPSLSLSPLLLLNSYFRFLLVCLLHFMVQFYSVVALKRTLSLCWIKRYFYSVFALKSTTSPGWKGHFCFAEALKSILSPIGMLKHTGDDMDEIRTLV